MAVRQSVLPYISSDIRERARFFDSSVERLRDDIQRTPLFLRRLGQVAAQVLAQLDVMYPINEAHGLHIPRNRAHTDDIPVGIVRPGERHRVCGHYLGLTPTQLENAWRQLGGQLLPGVRPESREAVEARLMEPTRAISRGMEYTPLLFAHGVAQVNTLSTHVHLPPDHYRRIGGGMLALTNYKPIMFLMMGPAYQEGAPASLLHELRHVQQRQEEPLLLVPPTEYKNHSIGLELEACYTAGQYELSLRIEGREPYAGGGSIHMHNYWLFMEAHNNQVPDNPFEATPEVRANWAHAGRYLHLVT